jgi:hypothetical protein
MQLYISWSGQISYKVALSVRDLVRKVLPDIDVWVSAEDINAGSRWSPELIRIFDQMAFSIICVDPSNQRSNWLNYETGAIAKSIGRWKINVFLFDLPPDGLRGPLTQYQTIRLELMDVRKMFENIHANISGIRISKQVLNENLTMEWPEFQKIMQDIHLEPAIAPSVQLQPATQPQGDGSKLEYIDDVDEKIMTLLFINEGIDEEKIATTVYLGRGECLRHLIDLESKELVWSNLSFGTRRWYVTDKGRKYLPGVYQGYGPDGE